MRFTPAELSAGARPLPRRPRRGATTLILLVLGAALACAAWLGWRNGWLRPAAMPDAMPMILPSPSPSTSSAAIVTAGNLIATNAALADATARLTALQQRLAELNQQALAAESHASRAEALLVAFAARRAIERGQPLGVVEPALRVRFGASQPNAVDRIISAAQKPETLADLSSEFATLEPRLVSGPANEGLLDWAARQAGAIFVIRHEGMPSPAPESRLARARAAIATARVDLAIAEVSRMPGKDAATDWLAHARDWIATEHALDQIEGAALALPAVAPAPAPVAVANP